MRFGTDGRGRQRIVYARKSTKTQAPGEDTDPNTPMSACKFAEVLAQPYQGGFGTPWTAVDVSTQGVVIGDGPRIPLAEFLSTQEQAELSTQHTHRRDSVEAQRRRRQDFNKVQPRPRQAGGSGTRASETLHREQRQPRKEKRRHDIPQPGSRMRPSNNTAGSSQRCFSRTSPSPREYPSRCRRRYTPSPCYPTPSRCTADNGGFHPGRERS